MTNTGNRSSRGAGDLGMMRRSTRATLWLIVLVAGAVQLLVGVDGLASARAALLVAGTVGSTIAALAIIPRVIRGPVDTPSGRSLVVAGLALPSSVWVLAVLPPFAGWGWALTLAVAGGMAACLVRGRRRYAVILATYIVIALGGLIGSVQPEGRTAGLVPAAAVPGAVLIATVAAFSLLPLSTVWFLHIAQRLEDARRMASELAVAEERLRFATDLHDIQGHHLQVIALKSEVAERVLADRPEQAAGEIAAIRVIAQSAMDDTRAVVNNYRTVTVAVEARNAAEVLRAAGIRCEVRIETAGMPSDVAAVFALAIREATTNILKHSQASEASIRLGHATPSVYRLTVGNDGARGSRRAGTGLDGLSLRVSRHGGRVETERRAESFTLIVEISGDPAPAAPEPASGVTAP